MEVTLSSSHIGRAANLIASTHLSRCRHTANYKQKKFAGGGSKQEGHCHSGSTGTAAADRPHTADPTDTGTHMAGEQHTRQKCSGTRGRTRRAGQSDSHAFFTVAGGGRHSPDPRGCCRAGASSPGPGRSPCHRRPARTPRALRNHSTCLI